MHPVSVIIPHYNEPPERLAKTVRSALRAGASHVVVADDGSDVAPAVESPAQLVSLAQHSGIAGALNLGLSHATEDWICWLSCGDTMTPDKLTVQLAADKPATFHAYVNGPTGKVRRPLPNWRAGLYKDNQFCGSTIMVRRNLAGWNTELQYCVDWEFALRVEMLAGWTYIDAVLGTAGEYPDGHTATADWDRKTKDRQRVVRWARYQRRRNANRPLHAGV